MRTTAGRRGLRLPLALCIALPFALLGALVSALLLAGGSRALGRAAESQVRLFSEEFGQRLALYAEDFLQDPSETVATTAEELGEYHFAPDDRVAVLGEILPKLRNHRWLGALGVSLPSGADLSVARSPETGELLVLESGPRTGFRQLRRSVGEGGSPGALLALGQAYDPRSMPWFREAAADRPRWSAPAGSTLLEGLGLTVAMAVPDREGGLAAVVHGSLGLAQMSRFLRANLPPLSPLAFIEDVEGRILASSSVEAERDEEAAVLGGEKSLDPLLRDAVRASVTGPGPFRFASAGRSLVLNLVPLSAPSGESLRVGVVTEPSALEAPLQRFRGRASLLVAAGGLLTILLAFLLARLLARPVEALRDRTRLLAEGRWPEPGGAPSLVAEFDELERGFDAMARRLEGAMGELEARVAERTAELESLLGEVNHRIKNTLNIAASLLGLQAGLAKSPESSAALEEAALRIKSMSLLYSRLHLGKDRRSVDLGSFLPAIVDSLAAGSIGPRPVRVEPSFESVVVDSRVASALGIVLTELFTNACKYAFPGGRAGRIGVLLARRGEELILEVEDDGVGFPPGFVGGEEGGFGLSVSGQLVEDLGGRLEIGGGPGGALLRLRIPSPPPGLNSA